MSSTCRLGGRTDFGRWRGLSSPMSATSATACETSPLQSSSSSGDLRRQFLQSECASSSRTLQPGDP
ncbi:hypothetical protein AAC387_Pa01g2023 [Persea americana]